MMLQVEGEVPWGRGSGCSCMVDVARGRGMVRLCGITVRFGCNSCDDIQAHAHIAGRLVYIKMCVCVFMCVWLPTFVKRTRDIVASVVSAKVYFV